MFYYKFKLSRQKCLLRWSNPSFSIYKERSEFALRKKRSKKVKQNYRFHAKTRALQRFDIDLTKKTHDLIVREIQAGGNDKHEFEKALTNGRSIWKIRVLDSENNYITVRAIYSKQQKSLVTILPELEKKV